MLAVLKEPANPSQACNCFCGARHPEQRGVCVRQLDQPGRRVWLDSLYDVDGTGVPLCEPCARAWPDIVA